MKDKATQIAETALNAAIAHKDSEVELLCMNDVEMKPVDWLWYTRIACGKITVIAGNPGLGKSQLMASMTATVSTGMEWPDCCKNTAGSGSTIILSAEDDPADTIKPRLIAARANLEKCHVLSAIRTTNASGKITSRTFNLTQDIERLAQAVEKIADVKLIIIDPISAYLGDTDSHNNADIRGALAPLSEMAARYGVAIVLVTHLNKSKEQDPIGRIIGSIGMIAAARAGYIVIKDEQNPATRYLIPVKNNIGNDEDGFAFHIEGVDLGNGIETSKIVWHEGVVEAQKILHPEKRTQTSGVKALILDLLSKGPMPAADVIDAGESFGYSKSSIQRAAKVLGVERKKQGMDGGWLWSLPIAASSSEGAEDTKGIEFSASESSQDLLSFSEDST